MAIPNEIMDYTEVDICYPCYVLVRHEGVSCSVNNGTVYDISTRKQVANDYIKDVLGLNSGLSGIIQFRENDYVKSSQSYLHTKDILNSKHAIFNFLFYIYDLDLLNFFFSLYKEKFKAITTIIDEKKNNLPYLRLPIHKLCYSEKEIYEFLSVNYLLGYTRYFIINPWTFNIKGKNGFVSGGYTKFDVRITSHHLSDDVKLDKLT